MLGIEADIQLAETVKAATRMDAGKQLYYQWDAPPTGNVVLIAKASAGGCTYSAPRRTRAGAARPS